ncbi:MAG: site-specific DNA-methyltransferase [Caldilinea sp.]|nr:site-specific DNA-methyltransferase [Caldilinea sp.]MDW8441326.1 site-specific DNA-methyltransferase [Caldilineaceae bacterium]
MNRINVPPPASDGVVLSWPGKAPPTFPSPKEPRLVETFEPQRLANLQSPPPANRLYYADNLEALVHLLDAGYAGRFRLIYADPPYNSGVEWTRKARLRTALPRELNGVVIEQPQYSDVWPPGAYLQFIYTRLPLLRQLLAEDGSLWLHCDHRHAHHLRCLLDETFGAENYLNTITWRSQTARGAKVNAFFFPNSAHTILVYARNRSAPTRWHPQRRRIELGENEAAGLFMRDDRGFFRTSDPGTYSFERLKQLHAEGRLYAPYGGEVIVDEAQRRVYASKGGNLGVKYYLTGLGDGRYRVERGVDNIWEDIPGLGTTPGEDVGYPTQKTEALLERILSAGSDVGDWVLDPFCGSGTTPAVAQKLGRRWVACDVSYGAIQTTVRRLQAVCQQCSAPSSAPTDDATGRPCAIPEGFAVYTFEKVQEIRSPQEAVGKIDIAIARIEGREATIEVIVRDVAFPFLREPADAHPALDWRAAVDSIAIDPAYDGLVFRAAMADAPLHKRATVSGRYRVRMPTLPTTLALRIVDIAGGESMTTVRIEA